MLLLMDELIALIPEEKLYTFFFHSANTTKEHSKLIRSELKTNAPEWWGKDLYRLETIMDII